MEEQPTNLTLHKKLYPIKLLEENIDKLDIKKVLITQLLDVDFIKKYILNNNDDDDIDINFILQFQPHIQKIELINDVEINNLSMYKYQYDLQTIISNIDKLDMKVIIMTQRLTIDFIIDYIILDEDIMEESYASMYFIFNCQKHLDIDELYKKLKL